MPACITAASPRTHTLPGASFLTLSPRAMSLCAGGAASLPGAGTGQDVAAVVRGELGTPRQPMLSPALPTGRTMPVPAQPQSLVTGGWVTVPAEPHGVGRGRDSVLQGP